MYLSGANNINCDGSIFALYNVGFFLQSNCGEVGAAWVRGDFSGVFVNGGSKSLWGRPSVGTVVL